jgi:hypothetical protein
MGRRQATRLVLFLGCLVPLAVVQADTAPKRDSRFHREGAIEIRSYGESPRDLLALLVPFLAHREFVPDRPAADSSNQGAATFSGSNGDFVSTTGRFNCLIVVYLSRSSAKEIGQSPVPGNFRAFRLALGEFLAGLPTPRPVPRDIEWGAKSCFDSP